MPRPADPDAHAALLEAARDEFARRGLERARVEDVARRAGVSKGAFYLHFRTKEDAFREILQRFFGALEEHAHRREEAEARFRQREAAAPASGYAERLEFECAVDLELLELLWHNRRIVAVMDAAGGHRYAPLLSDFRARMRSIVARNIGTAQTAGRLRRDVGPDVMGDIVVGAYEDFARRMATLREKPDLARWIRSLLLVLYEGMLERPEATAAAPAAARGELSPAAPSRPRRRAL